MKIHFSKDLGCTGVGVNQDISRLKDKLLHFASLITKKKVLNTARRRKSSPR